MQARVLKIKPKGDYTLLHMEFTSHLPDVIMAAQRLRVKTTNEIAATLEEGCRVHYNPPPGTYDEICTAIERWH